ncbi:hypothetical protein ER308_19320 [Egibacter rhizosphaerae]|uniref:Uncharacterized protein n=1 Tax=Egibacter rhizosphaerae TaxID=1670831 RepID=A0A411YJZ7_9ACTN|nr:hypothetical protein [Egibacter rhizosphaerae]QBI21507.1 hypothetical protein ER308_19320 [Egibacter rhizosphaerae]
MLGLLACSGHGGDASGELDVDRYEDDRLAFAHPADWEMTVGEGYEREIRIERPADEADHAEALIIVAWPSLHSHDLDGAIGFFGRDEGEPEVSEVDEGPIDVAGADEAVLRTLTTTDAVVDEETAYRFWSVFAMSEAERVVAVTIGVDEDAVVDGQVVADTVLDSLELRPSWD